MKTLTKLWVLLAIVMACAKAVAQQNIPLRSVLSAPISNVRLTEKARNSIMAYNIIRSGNVTYLSGGVIELRSGFHVEAGANFHAAITADLPVEQGGTLLEDDLILKVYPNPFAENTHIEYYLNEVSNVNLSLVNLIGIVIAKPVQGLVQDRGTHKITFESEHLTSGMYSWILETPHFRKVYEVFKP